MSLARTDQDNALKHILANNGEGSGANGAIIHYKPEPNSCSIIDAEKLFLLDSGAQYIDGTTDITRTVHFGQPSSWEKECFTRVLQGHIALDQAIFPENYPGFVLDAFARSSLWKIGLDYRHGTGHVFGAALNVHEGPQSISFRFGNMTPLLRGMVVSNEPGYYEDHAFGIRD
ncbi:UNVERIFIED_CONTAM: Aminopeptidase P2 [Sesamum calycinum]|uniref:Aminopeptidase P2 n=1 Tax=Sesamum calycinum TaxID=2727403 RepID=A0AAW2ISU3_9LAMI